MFVIWFLVGLVIAGLMIYSQWSDIQSLQVSSQPILAKRLQRRGQLRVILVSVLFFVIFYFEPMQGFVSLGAFLICRSVLLIYLNQH
jgi:drug/metabolite transporter (DMT)-like permease